MKRIALAIGLLLAGFLWGEEEEPALKRPPEELLRWLRSKKIEIDDSVEKMGSLSKEPIILDLSSALSSTLENQWNIQVGKNIVGQNEGLLQQTIGAFNPVVGTSFLNSWIYDAQDQGVQDPGFGIKTSQDGRITTLNLFLQKLTRPGTQLALTGSIDQMNNPALAPSNRMNQGDISFTVTQPLLNGFIYNQKSVAEQTAGLDVRVAKNDLTQTISSSLLDVVMAYWTVVAAQKTLGVQEDSYRILNAVVDASVRLVEGGRLAASELNEQYAEIARQERDILGARQQVYEAYNNLLYQMGQERCRFGPNPPPLILDDFPSMYGRSEEWNVDFLIDLAMSHRTDVKAACLQVEIADWNLKLAEQNLWPTLDVELGFDYSNVEVGRKALAFFKPYDTPPFQKEVTAQVTFSVPIFNDAAKGLKKQAVEKREIAVTQKDQLWFSITQQTASALRDHLTLLDEIRFANEAVEWYEKALGEEIERVKGGYSSLFIVIDYEQRLRNTLLEQVLIYQSFANSVANLLFLTGTLALPDEQMEEFFINVRNYQHLLKPHG